MIRIDENGWRIDKRVPVAVILAIFIHIFGILIWASQLDARVDNMEKHVVGESAFNEKFARIEERLEHVKEDVSFIKNDMEKISERLLKK